MTTMYCDGLSPQGYPGYNAHPGIAPYIQRVPFEQAMKNPPRCATHDRPYLTEGGYRESKVIEAFRERGVITDQCDIDYGFGGATYCRPHGWSGGGGELLRDGRCPHQPIAAWIVRRHEAAA